MASQWRIRHKLMLGLLLVVGIMALLLGGSLYGLWSYYVTTQTIRLKQEELKHAEEFKEAVTRLQNLANPSKPVDVVSFKEAITDARGKLDAYQAALEDTVRQGYAEPGPTDDARRYIVLLTEGLELLKRALDRIPAAGASPGTSSEEYWRRQLEPAQVQITNMDSIARDLRNNIYDDLKSNFEGTRRHYQVPLWMIVPAAVLGLLMIGSMRWACYSWVINPLRDLEGGVMRVAQGDFAHRIQVDTGDEMQDLGEAFNDMTQRLQALYNDLARQVNERSRQLVRSEKLASVGFLAAGVAHEINNPLASIAFCSEALEARLSGLMRFLPTSVQKGDDLEVFMRYLKMIQEEAFRCKTITEKLLDFSRTAEKRRESTDLGQLIQSVLDITQHLQNSKGKHIAFESLTERVSGGRISAPVNAEEIKSVVLNLVVNALDSMEDGGHLKIRLSQRAGMAEMQFTDSGCGMSLETLENIFEPFFTRSRTGKGTGLGLTISHRIINQHGGEIEAASPGPNEGSTFTVRLPLQLAESNLAQETRRLAA